MRTLFTTEYKTVTPSFRSAFDSADKRPYDVTHCTTQCATQQSAIDSAKSNTYHAAFKRTEYAAICSAIPATIGATDRVSFLSAFGPAVEATVGTTHAFANATAIGSALSPTEQLSYRPARRQTNQPANRAAFGASDNSAIRCPFSAAIWQTDRPAH
jgi:hypothetical protein